MFCYIWTPCITILALLRTANEQSDNETRATRSVAVLTLALASAARTRAHLLFLYATVSDKATSRAHIHYGWRLCISSLSARLSAQSGLTQETST